MASDDPEFERKATDIIGLYLHPPQHAAVFCVDKQSAIPGAGSTRPGSANVAWSSRAPRLRVLSPRYVVPVCRSDVRCGRVHGKTAARHISDEFVDFLEDVVGLCKPKQEIHVILDNLSAHKTHKVASFLQ